MFLLPVICRGTNINSLCYTSSFNVCCSIPCLNDALPAHILNFLASWLHSVFFYNLPSKEELTLNLNSILCDGLLRVHDGFWKIVSPQSHLTVLVLASGDFLAVFFLFQNLPKSSKIHNETVSCRSYCYCRARRLREFIFFA